MKRCGIDFETLADYRDGRADTTTSERVRAHLASGCQSCEQNLSWLDTTVHALHASTAAVVPQAALSRAQALFRERFPQTAPSPQNVATTLAERIFTFAQLVFDSRQGMALAGARGASASSFHLIFSTDALDVELWQDPLADGSWYLIGQALPKESDSEIVPQSVILTPATGDALTIIPQSSEFHLRSIPSGLYQMTLRLADSDIQMENVQIGQSAHSEQRGM